MSPHPPRNIQIRRNGARMVVVRLDNSLCPSFRTSHWRQASRICNLDSPHRLVVVDIDCLPDFSSEFSSSKSFAMRYKVTKVNRLMEHVSVFHVDKESATIMWWIYRATPWSDFVLKNSPKCVCLCLLPSGFFSVWHWPTDTSNNGCTWIAAQFVTSWPAQNNYLLQTYLPS
jgi:hypothetical protein